MFINLNFVNSIIEDYLFKRLRPTITVPLVHNRTFGPSKRIEQVTEKYSPQQIIVRKKIKSFGEIEPTLTHSKKTTQSKIFPFYFVDIQP